MHLGLTVFHCRTNQLCLDHFLESSYSTSAWNTKCDLWHHCQATYHWEWKCQGPSNELLQPSSILGWPLTPYAYWTLHQLALLVIHAVRFKLQRLGPLMYVNTSQWCGFLFWDRVGGDLSTHLSFVVSRTAHLSLSLIGAWIRSMLSAICLQTTALPSPSVEFSMALTTDPRQHFYDTHNVLC